MTRAEQKLRDSVMSPLDAAVEADRWKESSDRRPLAVPDVDDHGGWADERDRAQMRDLEVDTRLDRGQEIYEGSGGAEAAEERPSEGDDGLSSLQDRPHQVNQSLARLEMNSLEVKLYLDSIDKRISRMEPRLEGMRGVEQESARMPDGEAAGWTAAPGAQAGAERVDGSAEQSDAHLGTQTGTQLGTQTGTQAGTQTAIPTSERRRRAQGVPVERRRPPHAVPGEFEPEETWGWDWKPVAGRWKPWAERWRPAAEQTRTWMLARRSWAPAAALGMAAVIGLAVWGAGQHGPSKTQNGVGFESKSTAGPSRLATEAAAANGGRKTSADVRWGAGGGSLQSRGGRPELSNHGGDSRSGRTSVEQGVPAPMAGMASTSVAGASSQGGPDGGSVVAPATSSTAATLAAANAAGVSPGAANPGVGTSAPATNSTAGDAGRSHDSASAGSGASPGADSSDANVSDTGSSKQAVSGRIIPPSGTRVHVSSGVMAGSLVYSRPPKYPRGFAGLFHTQGRVVLQAIISKSGRVENLRVISGHYMLRGAAKDAVRTWRYRPYHVNGSPVEVATIVSVEFQR